MIFDNVVAWALTTLLLISSSTAFPARVPFNRQAHTAAGAPSSRSFRALGAIGLERNLADVDEEGGSLDCPPGYYLDSVNEQCAHLSPLGRVSQAVEMAGPFRRASRAIGDLFGVDTKKISGLGVAFALSYSIISNVIGSITLSIAWYMSCKRVSAPRERMSHRSTSCRNDDGLCKITSRYILLHTTSNCPFRSPFHQPRPRFRRACRPSNRVNGGRSLRLTRQCTLLSNCSDRSVWRPPSACRNYQKSS